MSVLNTQQNIKTVNQVATAIKNLSKASFDNLVNVQKLGIQLLWHDPDFTPQEIIDALGDDAIKIFQYHGGLTDYLVAIAAIDGLDYTPSLPTAEFTVTDGKITVTVPQEG